MLFTTVWGRVLSLPALSLYNRKVTRLAHRHRLFRLKPDNGYHHFWLWIPDYSDTHKRYYPSERWYSSLYFLCWSYQRVRHGRGDNADFHFLFMVKCLRIKNRFCGVASVLRHEQALLMRVKATRLAEKNRRYFLIHLSFLLTHFRNTT